MKNAKRILAGAMALVSVLGLAACGGGGGTETTPAVTYVNPLDEEKQAAIADAASTADLLTGELENKTVKWLSNWDINPDSTGKKTPVELAMFQEKYGGEVKYYPTSWEQRFNDLSTYVMSDEGIDFYPYEAGAFPKGAVNGMFAPIDDYIDWSSPLWTDMKDIADHFVFGDGHYVVTTDIACDAVVFYNRTTIEENGFEDPKTLFENGEWTLDKFREMLMEFCVPGEKYGLDGWYNTSNLMATTGVPAVGLKDGKLVSNLKTPEVERAMDFQADLFNNGLAVDMNEFNWTPHDEYLGEGKELFYIGGIWHILGVPENWAKYGTPEELMFVPLPRDPEADAYYMPGSAEGYYMVKGGHNPEGVIKFAECKRYTVLDETVAQVGLDELMETDGWTQEMIDMQTTVKEMTAANPVFAFYTGASDDIASILDSTDGLQAAIRVGTPWATTRGTIADAIEEWINEINVKAGVA